MNKPSHAAPPRRLRAVLLLALSPLAVQAQGLSLAQSPLFLGTGVKPNVLVVYDNSQSMDGTMGGALVAGDRTDTRGNIARTVLRSTITTYRNVFNWGLASFDVSSVGLYTTYPYYFGDDTQVRYTNDCVNGVSASTGGLRCIANPQTSPGNGYSHLTYRYASDDADINDVFYYNDVGNQIFAVGVENSTNYYMYRGRDTTTDWARSNFNNALNSGNAMGFTETDAGFLPKWPNRRMVFVRRAWGYNGNISGSGRINQAVAADSTSQYNALMSALANETSNGSSSELKNAAVFTPLSGTLSTVRNYFTGSSSPISQSCQANFVLLATDGRPTGRTNGTMYTAAELTNTCAAGSCSAFSTAANDVFSRITALRSTTKSSTTYDIQTYVIGLGDMFNKATNDPQGNIAALNRMASLGGTDSAFVATDSDALTNAFRAISVDIISRTAAASSVSLNSGSWNTGSKVYQGRFNSGDWSGQLLAYALSSSGEPAATPDWDAGQRLNAIDWNASTGRQILTYKPSAALGSRGVPFRWPADANAPAANEIDAGLIAALNRNGSGTTDGYGSQRLEFLRGNTAREERNCSNCGAPVFRNRPTSVLGDIVNSAPVYVGGATGDFRDTMETARYSTYANARASQTPVIYVGANDGMLHAFNANNGNELFAYVPYAVRSRLPSLTTNPYSHLYSVDGSPAVGDVYYGGGWKTLLVSGMNAGAPGLFALDATYTSNFTESHAANVVRWEIGDSDGDVGYIFGRPILTKTRDGRWRAITGNGYNSANGHAVLLLVDLETGALTKIDTGVGSTDTPNGLSAVTVVSSNDNGVGDTVYAGDLRGNLWKFDLSATSATSWSVAYRSAGSPAPLFAAGSTQPITARPDVTRFPKGGYMLVFGTGRYIDTGDNSTTASQSLYGIWDRGSAVALADLQLQSVNSVLSRNGKNYRLTTHAVGLPADTLISGDNAITLENYYANKRGWRMVLPTSRERVVAEATVRAGRLVASSLIPSTAVCSFGGDGWIMDLDVITGNRSPALDTNGDNLVDDNDLINGSIVSGVQVGSVPAAATIMRTRNRKLDDKLINTSAGSIVRVRESGSTATSRRAAWEQLQ